MSRTVYLAGAINNCTDDEAFGWRVGARRLLTGFRILDPMARDYRGKEAENVDAIVDGDLNDIFASDIILVNAQKPSWGTAMEIVYAHKWCKTIVTICANEKPSPWLVWHSTKVLSSLASACEWVAENYGENAA